MREPTGSLPEIAKSERKMTMAPHNYGNNNGNRNRQNSMARDGNEWLVLGTFRCLEIWESTTRAERTRLV